MANRAYICDMNALYISGFEPLARNRGGGGAAYLCSIQRNLFGFSACALSRF